MPEEEISSSQTTDLAELRSVLVHMKRRQGVINNFVEPTDEEKEWTVKMLTFAFQDLSLKPSERVWDTRLNPNGLPVYSLAY